MHWRAHSTRMRDFATYDGPGGVVGGVREELAGRVEAILAAGIERGQVVLDPGLGFAKTAAHNWALLAGLDRIEDLGFPVLVGASRKSFLGTLLADEQGVPRTVDDREAAHAVLVAHLARHGVWGVRVHDVRATCDALAVVDRLAREGDDD
jgi:dihydropteroate synthase